MSRTVNFSAGEQLVQRIPLSNIVISYNIRNPAKGIFDEVKFITKHEDGREEETVEYEISEKLHTSLVEEGVIEDAEVSKRLRPMDLMHALALSDDSVKQAAFLKIIEENESYPHGLKQLADDRSVEDGHGELEPVLLREIRGKTDTNFGVVGGERRTLAAAYNYLKRGQKPTVGAIVKKITVAEAKEQAFQENFSRKEMTEVEIGRYLHSWTNQINPATGKYFSLREIAEREQLDYQYVRGRSALMELTETEQRALAEGRIGLTAAINKGLTRRTAKGRGDAEDSLAEKEEGAIPEKKVKRDRVLTMKEVQEYYDNYRIENDEKSNTEEYKSHLSALAYVMQKEFEVAEKESDARFAALEVKEAAAGMRKAKKEN